MRTKQSRTLCQFVQFMIEVAQHPNFLAAVLIFILIILACGCGHNMLVENEMIGLACRVPVGEANYVGITIGSSKQVVAAVRGGASFESTTSAGGGIFTANGAENKITTFRSNLQYNEGYLNEAFTSPDVPMEVKLKLAEGIVEAAKAPKFPDSIVTTRDAVMQVGAKAVTSNAVSVARLQPTGIDNVVNKTPEIIGAVTDPVTETVHNLVNPLEGTVSSVTNVVSEVKEVVTEVNDTIDHAEGAAEKVLTKSEKTIMILFGSFTLAVSFILLVLSISSLLRKKPVSKKVHVGHHLDDEVPTEVHGDTEFRESVPEPKPETHLSWFQKARAWVVNAVVTIVGFVGLIPSPVRKKAVEALVKAWKEHKAKKQK